MFIIIGIMLTGIAHWLPSTQQTVDMDTQNHYFPDMDAAIPARN